MLFWKFITCSSEVLGRLFILHPRSQNQWALHYHLLVGYDYHKSFDLYHGDDLQHMYFFHQSMLFYKLTTPPPQCLVHMNLNIWTNACGICLSFPGMCMMQEVCALLTRSRWALVGWALTSGLSSLRVSINWPAPEKLKTALQPWIIVVLITLQMRILVSHWLNI